MPYATGRVIHDADAHIMETPTWLRDHAEPASVTPYPSSTYPGGNELRQTGGLEEQQTDHPRDLRPPSGAPRLQPSIELTKTPRSWHGRTSLRPARSSPRTAPGRSISWASGVS